MTAGNNDLTYRKFFLLSILPLMVAIAACGTKWVPTVEERPTCSTSIEGFFHSENWCAELYLVPANSQNERPFKLTLLPRSPFSFCMPPGTYLIKNISFINAKWLKVHFGTDFPELYTVVEKGASNYIGDLYVDNGNCTDQSKIGILCEIDSSPAVYGVLFGAIGAATAAALPHSPTGVTAQHWICIESDDDFSPRGRNPLKANLIQRQLK